MASQSRTLKLSILGDVDQLNKSLKAANSDVNNSANTISDFGKKAAAAFAVAGAAALAFAVSSIKNALADEAAQRKLEETLRATTTANEAQIKSVGDWIDTTSIAIGVTDDNLRPAFARLIRSTNDVEEAQKLLNLALDISAATGKPLEAVSNALGKAYDGNATSLSRLGLGLDATILKGGNTDKIFQALTNTFGNFAENEAQSTEAQFRRVTIALDEAKESIGAALLPIVEKLASFLITTAVPNLNSFISALTGKGSLKEATDNATAGAFKFGEQVRKVFGIVVDFKEELLVVTGVIAGVFVVSKIAAAVTATIALIKSLIVAYNLLKTSAIVTGVATAFALNPLLGVGAVALAAGVMAGATALANRNDFETPSTGALGFPSGFTAPSVPSTPIPTVPKVVAPTVSGLTSGTKAVVDMGNEFVGANFRTNTSSLAGIAAASGPPNVTVNMGVVGDPEAAARTITTVLNNSFYRGTGGAGGLIT